MVRSLLTIASLTTALKIASAGATLPRHIDLPPSPDKPDTSSLTTKIQKCALSAAESISIPDSETYAHNVGAQNNEVRVLKTRTAIVKSGSLNTAVILNANTPYRHEIVGYTTHNIGVEVNTFQKPDGQAYIHFYARHEGSYDFTPDALAGVVSITVSPEGKTTKRTGNITALDFKFRADPQKFPHFNWTRQAIQSMEYAFTKCANIEMADRPQKAVKEVTAPFPYKAGVSATSLGLIRQDFLY
jgi:hypothetical protein